MKRVLTVLAVALVMAAMMVATAAPAFAKITEEPVRCETRGGGVPPGQQPECQGGGLEQETENRNPAGHAPPGHN
jgi:hypothetical protein